MTVAARSGFFTETFHQLRAINATPQGKAFPAAEPHERKSVRDNEVRILQNSLEAYGVLRLHQAVHVRDGDVAAGAPPPNPRFHRGHHIRNLDSVDAHAEDAVG